MENTQVGPFLVKQRLGTNRRQQVFLAKQVEQNKDVALKFISIPPDVPRDKALDKIEREGKFLQKLRHPNLVRLYGAGVEEDKIFFAHELVSGESLAAIMARRGKLAPDLAVDFASQICDLLQYIHQHELLHAKLTPDKILIDNEGVVKVTDLRINRTRRKRWDAVTTRRELDLAAYMAPEQQTDGVSVKSDLYSLGVITYEMLTGSLPYAPDTIRRMNKRKLNEPVPSAAKLVMNCPVWLDQIVTQMLQPEPRSRPHTAKAVGMAFDEIKKIDRNKKAAIAQIIGNFNPLNAGTDKSEARRLLNKRKKKKRQTPFFESATFLIGSLVLIISIGTYALWPTSTKKMYERGIELVKSETPGDWSQGRSLLRKVIARENDDFTRSAEGYMLFSRRRSLINQAEIGKITGVHSNPVKAFIAAFQLESQDKFPEAIAAYSTLLEKLEPGKAKREVVVETTVRLERLKNYVELPSEKIALTQLIEEIKLLETEEELREARKKLTAIIDRFGSNHQYSSIVKEADLVRKDLDFYVAKLVQDRVEASANENETEDADKAEGNQNNNDGEIP